MLRSLLFAAAAPRPGAARPSPDEARYQAADPASGPPPPAHTGYRPRPGPGPGPPGSGIGRSAKWALVLAAAVFIFRRAIASVVLTALAATLHFLGLNVHLPTVRFAWPWQAITRGHHHEHRPGPVGAAEDRGHLPARAGPGQLHLRVHAQGVQEHRHLSVLVRQHVLRRGSRVGHRRPQPRPGLVGARPGALPAPGAEQAAGRAAGAGDGHDDAARPAAPPVGARRHDRQPAVQAGGHPAQLDLSRLRLRRAAPAAVRRSRCCTPRPSRSRSTRPPAPRR